MVDFNRRPIILVASTIANCQVNLEENLVSNRTIELWIDLQSGYYVCRFKIIMVSSIKGVKECQKGPTHKPIFYIQFICSLPFNFFV